MDWIQRQRSKFVASEVAIITARICGEHGYIVSTKKMCQLAIDLCIGTGPVIYFHADYALMSRHLTIWFQYDGIIKAFVDDKDDQALTDKLTETILREVSPLRWLDHDKDFTGVN